MAILDQYGSPVKLAELREPQTAKLVALERRVITSHLDGLTPDRVARILKRADNGDITAQHELFEDMLDRDAHMLAEFGKRAGAMLTLDWSIKPPRNASRAEKKAAQAVEDLLRDAVDDLEDVLLTMMDGVAHGFAPIELQWQRIDGTWLPQFLPRPQSWFRLDPLGRELRLDVGGADGESIVPMCWIMHRHAKPKTGYLGRAGLGRTLIWPFLYKAFGLGDFAEFLETWGLPIVMGKYPHGSPPNEKASLLRAVASLARDARAIMPEDMSIEISKVTGSGSASPHLEMVAWAEGAQSKAILGQVLSTEARATGLGSGVAYLHREVREDIKISDARQLAGTLTRDLVYPLLVLNGWAVDLRRRPRWQFDTSDTADISQMADALPKLVGMNMRIPVAWAHERMGVPIAEPSEDVLAVARPEMVAPPEMRTPGATAAPPQDVPAPLLAAARAGAGNDDGLAPVIDRLARSAQPVIDGWVGQIAALIAQPDMTLERLQDALLDAYGELDTDTLVTRMEVAYQLAQIAGMNEVLDDAER